MLDVEIVTAPTDTALNVVTLAEFQEHLRLSPALRANVTWQANMTAALKEAVDELHGFDGSLNRMVLPCTLKRYLRRFPENGQPIKLPYPNLISVDAITIEDGSSPDNNLDAVSYVSTGTLVGEVWAVGDWPQITEAPRAVSVTYKAGYSAYPDKLKRLVKILAAHFLENPEATINEERQMQINRKVDFGVESLRTALRIPVSYDDWL